MTNLSRATAHGKINLHLGVGAAREDGYHDLVTVFQSVDTHDTVTLLKDEYDFPRVDGSAAVSLECVSHVRGEVPEDPGNLAWRAFDLVVDDYANRYGTRELPPVSIRIDKRIPVAGGMAGGSADAAAALLAADDFLARTYGVAGLGRGRLVELGASLGADVPFTLVGGTALGTGRGDHLTTMLSRGKYHWALILSKQGLSTPKVFGKLDELRGKRPELTPALETRAVAEALIQGDPFALGAALHNDLQAAALSLKPDLRRVLELGKESGAIAGLVSGSGPTCAFLCEDAATVDQLIVRLSLELPGTSGLRVSGPAEGAYLGSPAGR
ncbi:4-diphosphocytidyl-2-C-methyl-D-erythritol kinase [Corynebacterium maris DSM 45190]|uniref:4-diphosphocytidyl-2-C-methyl-D-erythritol kinase n=1 Tax=Corynebacterium maris DSM 45190 TaxID=1224163 RepID=S5ST41_9CORY|nr:4-(cytidine 5'-diphospho)-2-C-methyl-D-erythritol kinase [Corynebacterium maris]AGS34319.1 4-diphosphocytidyl-2-C-methyl-D-erythritol kinase [Corynebacterium maris DSM 45190]